MSYIGRIGGLALPHPAGIRKKIPSVGNLGAPILGELVFIEELPSLFQCKNRSLSWCLCEFLDFCCWVFCD